MYIEQNTFVRDSNSPAIIKENSLFIVQVTLPSSMLVKTLFFCAKDLMKFGKKEWQLRDVKYIN